METKTPKFDYSDIHWQNNGKIKLCIIVGTRPEIIRLAAVISKCRKYFDVILAHTGQNYDYNLNGIFFRDLKLAEPEVYMDAVGDDLGATCGNIINCSYKLFAATKPDAVLVLGDTNSCLSVIGAKRLHIPIFHMEAGNRCKDECLPEETNRRFLEYVQGGGGVVIYHAADNAFVNWPEYNKICALGGWENRDEKAGPYVYWSDGKLIKDSSAGVGGSHGKQHEYVLNARNHEHPIMKGLPNKWKHAQDELYDRMRGPGNIKDCLYTAYSDKETGGSGREEPLIFTVDYGNARIFHTMLGHAGETVENCPAMQCAGFQITLLRGAEWAATGKVTQKVPADFPTEKQVSNRSNYKR